MVKLKFMFQALKTLNCVIKHSFTANHKGQAAITDALIFLSIVGVVSTMVIVSAMNYGLTITQSINDSYETSYLDAALKTFYVTTYGRDAKDIFDTDAGDYIMTKIKEEYSTYTVDSDPTTPNVYLTDNTKKSIFKILEKLFYMMPQKNYLFAIVSTTTGTEAPLFLGIKTAYDPSDGPQTETIYLDCMPPEPIDAIQAYLQYHTNGQKASVSKAIFFKNIIGTETASKEFGFIYLAMWNADPYDFSDNYTPNSNQEKQQFVWDPNGEILNCKVAKYID